jgi:SAM-dependent methyltransferase
MLDLVAQETDRIESRVLDPACGTGKFLIEILRRKLAVVSNRYKKSRIEYERYAICAVSSLYGIDLLSDNIVECRERLYQLFDAEYSRLYGNKAQERCREAARYILGKNILCGDALTLKTADGKPIVFAKWSFVNGSKVKRRDFEFSGILEASHANQANSLTYQHSLSFEEPAIRLDKENGFKPNPIREYPLANYWELIQHE